MSGDKEEKPPKILETVEERRERWKSIYIMYFTMFLMGLSFGIVLTSIWPYLDSLDPEAGKIFMGWIVAANPMAQMVFSPLIGWWSNKTKTFHPPLLFCGVTFIVANLLYTLLELFQENRKYWMYVSRFLVGMSSANVVICRAYIGAATTLEERTKSMSMIALMQVLGFTVGPAIQAAVSPLGNKSRFWVFGVIPINMYTAIGWLCVFCGVLNLILCLPGVLKYKLIAARQIMLLQNAESEKATWKSRKPDYLSSISLICAFGTLNFVFSLLETLGAPLSMEQFAWSKEQALFYMGILMAVGAIVAIFGFLIISPLSRLIGETRVITWVGFLLMFVGSLFGIPWGPHNPPIGLPPPAIDGNTTAILNDTELLGCPPSQEWCYYTPAVTIVQFIILYLLISFGYPIGVALIPAIFNKVLGPRPQGTWMGVLIGSGCFSRMLGPIFISYIYTKYGTTWSFSIISILQFIIFVWLLVLKNRFISVINSHTKAIEEKRQELEMVPLPGTEGKDHVDDM